MNQPHEVWWESEQWMRAVNLVLSDWRKWLMSGLSNGGWQDRCSHELTRLTQPIYPSIHHDPSTATLYNASLSISFHSFLRKGDSALSGRYEKNLQRYHILLDISSLMCQECQQSTISTLESFLKQDGFTYERSAISAWLEKHDTSPLTTETLSSRKLRPNHLAKQVTSAISDGTHNL